MYKAQADSAKSDSKNEKTDSGKKKDKGGDDVQDVDFEEVKDWKIYKLDLKPSTSLF